MNASLQQREFKLAVQEQLKAVRGFVFDMDGTIALGDKLNHGLKALPGALELLALLKLRGIPYVVFTNGTTRTPQHYAKTLRDAGFDLADEDMLTPASSAVTAFLRHGYRRVMVLGGEALSAPLRDAGLEVIGPEDYDPDESAPVDAVLIGWFREFGMEALEIGCRAVQAGAKLYSSSDALYFAASGGRALGTSRVIAAMIREVTGCRVHTVGKPSLDSLACAARRMGVRVRDLAVIGDDPVLEIPMAHRGKAMAIAVETGLGTIADFNALPAQRQPHLIVSGVDQLLSLYKVLP
ncbi:HAD hydrolase-like protein (plasmid) [Pseudomonas putida]|uniref:HAD-IIA family hydrolase n=1 Tax=Pseudomonas putida TaxID=303 RepID=UPI000C27B898|nr:MULTISPECIES: HAD hydrolase-like protein [Pseudomonas]QUG92766.1 HAD hydrolase-like protein [Pseudomonas putida]